MKTANPIWVEDHLDLADLAHLSADEPIPFALSNLGEAVQLLPVTTWERPVLRLVPDLPPEPPLSTDACEVCDGNGVVDYVIEGEAVDIDCRWCEGTGVRR